MHGNCSAAGRTTSSVDCVMNRPIIDNAAVKSGLTCSSPKSRQTDNNSNQVELRGRLCKCVCDVCSMCFEMIIAQNASEKQRFYTRINTIQMISNVFCASVCIHISGAQRATSEAVTQSRLASAAAAITAENHSLVPSGGQLKMYQSRKHDLLDL